MKTLIIFQNVPESEDVYILDLVGEDLTRASLCHGYYGGTVEADKGGVSSHIEWLGTLLSEAAADGRAAKVDFAPKSPPLLLVGLELLIITGWLM